MQTQLIQQLSILGFHFVVSVVSVASAAVTAAERSAFQDTFLLYLSYESLAMVSINKMLSCHAHFLLFLLWEIESFLSRRTCCICRIGRLCVRFPYGCICRKNFFDKTETTDTTDTTIWKPGLIVLQSAEENSVRMPPVCSFRRENCC